MIWICRRPGFWSAVRLALLSAPAGPAPTTKTSHLSRIGTWHSSQFLSVWLFLKWVELEETWYTCLGTVSVSISLGTFTVVHCSEKHVATLGISWASAGHLLRHLLRHLRLHTINSVATSRRYDLCVFFCHSPNGTANTSIPAPDVEVPRCGGPALSHGPWKRKTWHLHGRFYRMEIKKHQTFWNAKAPKLLWWNLHDLVRCSCAQKDDLIWPVSDLSVTCQVTCPSWSGPGSFILPAAHMALQLGPIWSTGLTLPGPPATSTMLAQYSTHLHTTIGFSIDINYYQLITVDLNWIKPVKVRSGLAVHIIFCPQKYC